MNIELSKKKSAIVILEGFGIFIAAHAVGGYFFAPRIEDVFFKFPQITAAMLSSSAISPLLAIVYLTLKIKFIPQFNLRRNMFPYLLSGMILSWMIVFVSMLFLEMKRIPLLQEILRIPHPYFYFYLTLFLFLIWGPFLEETLYRGYFFEILKQSWGNTKALLFSSVLFVIPHGIWGSFDISLLFTFLFSVVFTMTYMRGGLVASILVHTFVNCYLLYLQE